MGCGARWYLLQWVFIATIQLAPPAHSIRLVKAPQCQTVQCSNNTVVVSISLSGRVASVDESSRTITLRVQLRAQWSDPRASRASAVYVEGLWTPDLHYPDAETVEAIETEHVGLDYAASQDHQASSNTRD